VRKLSLQIFLTLSIGTTIHSAFAQVSADQIAAHPAIPQLAPNQTPGVEVTYESQGRSLRAVLYLPTGSGKVPAVLWNHGADKNPNPQPELAAFYLAHGYAFFVPFRSGHGGSPGQTVNERMAPSDPANIGNPVEDQRFVSLLSDAAEDTASAVHWLASNPRIQKDHIFMSGISYGGLECLIDANTLQGVRGYIVFSGGARLFASHPLAHRLETAVKQSRAPILLIQAANDYSTTPTKELGPLLIARRDGSKAILYPAFGDPKSVPMGHIAFSTWNLGTEIWGPDAIAFLNATSQNSSRP
jgi:dienelactone hydrolase